MAKVKCSECGKIIASKANLRKHMKIHKGTNKYPCSECSKTFSSASSVAKHRLIHRGELPFGCELCGRRFRQKNTMLNHATTHSAEKHHSCSECGKQFRVRTQMLKHLRVVHKTDTAGLHLNVGNTDSPSKTVQCLPFPDNVEPRVFPSTEYDGIPEYFQLL